MKSLFVKLRTAILEMRNPRNADHETYLKRDRLYALLPPEVILKLIETVEQLESELIAIRGREISICKSPGDHNG